MERLVLDLLLLGALLGVSALLAGAEAAYFSLSRLGSAHLEPTESAEHALLARVLRDPRDLLITLLVGITLVNIAASALATQVATLLLGPRGIGIAIPVMVFLIVVFGEVLPMTIAVGMPHRFGLLVARPVLALQWVLTPVRLLHVHALRGSTADEDAFVDLIESVAELADRGRRLLAAGLRLQDHVVLGEPDVATSRSYVDNPG